MPARTTLYNGTSVLMEMQEFAAFPKGTQRYIRRSLDVGLRRRDSRSGSGTGAIGRWARGVAEAETIRAQQDIYRALDDIRGRVADPAGIRPTADLMAALIHVSAFDLGEGRLPGFSAYRFLYERLIGASVRPWLPAAFCAAAALPHLQPDQRIGLLATVAEAAAAPGWSSREPGFLPEWVEKVDAATVP